MPCPHAEAAKKRAADEAYEEQRAAKKGKFVPRVGDWKCSCGYWNRKFWFYCRGRGGECEGIRVERYIKSVQEPGERIEERICKAKFFGDWLCRCGSWRRSHHNSCHLCGGTVESGCWEYTASDEKLRDAPEPETMTQAQKTSRWFATAGRTEKKKKNGYY